MNSFYSTLYGKFADLQVDQSFSARFVYPSTRPVPSLKPAKEISDCIVRIPRVHVKGSTISYGPFLFEDTEFGQVSAVKLGIASTCLLSAKCIFNWLYFDYQKEWLGSKKDKLKATYTVNTIFDLLARQRIRQVEGPDFYNDIMHYSDLLASALLPCNPKDFGVMAEATLTSLLLNIPINTPTAIVKAAQNFVLKLNTLPFDPSRLIDIIRDRISNENGIVVSRPESGWDLIAIMLDSLYPIIDKMPGKWHSVYLPYSDAFVPDQSESIFKSKTITENESNLNRDGLLKERVSDNKLWLEIFFELMRETNRYEKMLSRLSRATSNLNFGSVGFPLSDYASYYKLHSELGPQIRRMIERVSLIKNVLDENAFEETGNIDLQVAIQAIASETARNDIFIKEENLLKDESWTILIDSSLSLSGSSKQLKAVSVCLAETARQIMGSNPWAMFAFSDDFYCVKDFSEPYDSQVKARIGGLGQNGPSHIPDAIRACRTLIAEHPKDRNHLILVSDGLPSGYPNVEAEFATSIKELGKYGVNLAAIAIGSSSIKKKIRNARVVDAPADMVKEFVEIYQNLSF
jgi:hypothetical protein